MREGGLIRARDGDEVVIIFKDVVLGAILEIVLAMVSRWRVVTLKHLTDNGQNWFVVCGTYEGDSRCCSPAGASRRGSWHRMCSYRV